jgi:hypothetical protein
VIGLVNEYDTAVPDNCGKFALMEGDCCEIGGCKLLTVRKRDVGDNGARNECTVVSNSAKSEYAGALGCKLL